MSVGGEYFRAVWYVELIKQSNHVNFLLLLKFSSLLASSHSLQVSNFLLGPVTSKIVMSLKSRKLEV